MVGKVLIQKRRSYGLALRLLLLCHKRCRLILGIHSIVRGIFDHYWAVTQFFVGRVQNQTNRKVRPGIKERFCIKTLPTMIIPVHKHKVNGSDLILKTSSHLFSTKKKLWFLNTILRFRKQWFTLENKYWSESLHFALRNMPPEWIYKNFFLTG